MTDTLLTESAAVGSLLGLAVGDALGAPVEFRARGSFDKICGMRAGGRFNLPAGAWTDDTAMALCLAQSLLVHPKLNEHDLLTQFCHWVDRADWTSTGVCVGIGQNTLMALGNFRRTGALRAPPNGPKSDGNGTLMRLAPVAIMHWQNFDLAREVARRQSEATHHSAVAASCCEYLATVLCALISGLSWVDACNLASDTLSDAPDEMLRLSSGGWRRKASSEIRASGYCLDALEAGLWAVEASACFKEAVLTAVNLGEDADTVGAIAGQLAGARYGYQAIPVSWLHALKRKDEIFEIAQQVFFKSGELSV